MEALSPVLPNPIREPSPVLRTRIPVLRTRICECYTLSTENEPVLRDQIPVLRIIGPNPGHVSLMPFLTFCADFGEKMTLLCHFCAGTPKIEDSVPYAGDGRPKLQ